MTPITSTSASPFDAPAGAWSHEAWRAGERAYKAILHLPFVTELTAGNLSRERFMRYISQDSLYLGQYSRVLAHIASRTGDPSVRSAFLKFAADGVAVEQPLHQSFLDGMTAGSPAPRMSPACLFYTSLLKSMAYEPVEVEAAATLPCFWIYREVGEWITAHRTSGNPYDRWIDTYADPAFKESTDLAIGLCNRMAADASTSVRQRMTEVYAECSRMEWLFWHSAYTDLNYPVEL